MKIVSWNINSLKARLDHVQTFLSESSPDVLMVQELKGLEFPADQFEGWHTHAVGQKAYNGVAVFSKLPFEVVMEALPGDESDEQARYLEIELSPPLTSPPAGGKTRQRQGGSLRLINIYAPNGNPVDTEKFPYKLGWLERLYDRLKQLRENDTPFIVGGDFNIIPEARDCYDPKVWINDALYKLESRQKYRALINLGLTDALRIESQLEGQYTFWDYQAGCWPAGKGIRIDHFLLSPTMTDRFESCVIDKVPRGWDKASDHTPIILEVA